MFARLARPIVLAWGFRRALLAFLAGAASTLALAPLNFWPAMFVTIPVAIWLTEKPDDAKEYLPKISQYFKGAALTVFGGVAGPKDWGINTDAHLTAVVAHKGKVVKSFGYMSLNETDVPEVIAALKKATKK